MSIHSKKNTPPQPICTIPLPAADLKKKAAQPKPSIIVGSKKQDPGMRKFAATTVSPSERANLMAGYPQRRRNSSSASSWMILALVIAVSLAAIWMAG